MCEKNLTIEEHLIDQGELEIEEVDYDEELAEKNLQENGHLLENQEYEAGEELGEIEPEDPEDSDPEEWEVE